MDGGVSRVGPYLPEHSPGTAQDSPHLIQGQTALAHTFHGGGVGCLQHCPWWWWGEGPQGPEEQK